MQLEWSPDDSFKQVSGRRINADFVYTSVINNPWHENIFIHKETSYDNWEVVAQFECEYSTHDNRLCMKLNPSYSLLDVKNIVQAGWEACVLSSFFQQPTSGNSQGNGGGNGTGKEGNGKGPNK